MYSNMLGKNSLKLFDVTLRDGLQSLKKVYSLAEKSEILRNIIVNRHPSAIEVGSIVSPKILPQMSESIELFHEAQFINIIIARPIDLYMLTPNLKSVNIASDYDIKNFSFITSVSNDFQKKKHKQKFNRN
jgi:hydroxymethylglutaryl-CoA lyase